MQGANWQAGEGVEFFPNGMVARFLKVRPLEYSYFVWQWQVHGCPLTGTYEPGEFS